MVFVCFEFPVAMAAVDDEGCITLLLHKPSIYEFRHQTSSHLASLMICLKLSNLLLKLLHHVILGLGLLLLGSCCFLVSSDLSHGPAPLTLGLEHVGSLTLRC